MGRPPKVQLSEEDQDKLAAEARAEAEAEVKAKLAESFKLEEKLRIKRAMLAESAPAEGELVEYTIQLAPGPHDRIVIDGRVFMHGGTYKVNPGTLAVLKEQVHRTWMHDAEIHGMDMNEMNGRKKIMARV